MEVFFNAIEYLEVPSYGIKIQVRKLSIMQENLEYQSISMPCEFQKRWNYSKIPLRQSILILIHPDYLN